MIEELLDDRAKLATMASAARNAAHPHAADDLVAWARGVCVIPDVRPFMLKADDALSDALVRLSANGTGGGVVADGDRTILGTVLDAEIRAALLTGTPQTSPVSDVMMKGAATKHAAAGRSHRREGPAGRRRAEAGHRNAGRRGRDGRRTGQAAPSDHRQGAQAAAAHRPPDDHRADHARPCRRRHRATSTSPSTTRPRCSSADWATARRLGVRVHYLHEDEALGTAGPLGLLPERPKGPVLVTNADIITRLHYGRLLEYHRLHGGRATIAAIGARRPHPLRRVAHRRARSCWPGREARHQRAGERRHVRARARRRCASVKPGVALDMPVPARAVARQEGRAVHVFPVRREVDRQRHAPKSSSG